MIRATQAKALILAVMMSALAACSPVYRNHGYTPAEQDLALLEIGKSTREDVALAIGRPGSTGLLEGSGWYYVGSRWKHYGPYAPQELSREVVAVTFTPSGTLANIERFGLQNGNVVALSRRVTTANVQGVTVIKQLLGSLGKLNPGQMLEGKNASDPFVRR